MHGNILITVITECLLRLYKVKSTNNHHLTLPVDTLPNSYLAWLCGRDGGFGCLKAIRGMCSPTTTLSARSRPT